MSEQKAMRCYIAGRVQGVFYRASARDVANKHEIKGWAKNLVDGRVEVVACGAQEDLALFLTWLKKGPRLAEVSEFSYEEIAWFECKDFVVL